MSIRVERWIRIAGLGLIIWVVPLIARHSLYWIQLYSEYYFNPVIMLIGLTMTAIAMAIYLPHARGMLAQEGWIIGSIWLAGCLVLDMCFYYCIQAQFDAKQYLFSIAWQYLYIPIVTIPTGYFGHAIDSMLPQTGNNNLPFRH